MHELPTKNAIAVISGGMGYVGRAIATRLAKGGMRIVLVYCTSPRESADVFLASLGGMHAAYQCDLRDASAVQEMYAAIERECGPIGICIHAAGTPPLRTPLYQASAEEVLDGFTAQALSGFNFLATGAGHMKARKEGVLIGITTAAVAVPDGAGSLGAYLPAKYALQGILASFRTELAPYGIRVYSVAPGFMEGGMNSFFPKAFVELIRAKSPTQTIATAEDVAKRISYLVSDAGRAVTDLTIVIAPELEGATVPYAD